MDLIYGIKNEALINNSYMNTARSNEQAVLDLYYSTVTFLVGPVKPYHRVGALSKSLTFLFIPI